MSELNHECYIGILYDYDNTDIVTISELKRHIHPVFSRYSLADYCDWRKSTDLFRFRLCPLCGREIDWKALKRGDGQ
jgi:hypothetical protein